MLRNLTSILIIFLIFASCNNKSEIAENYKDLPTTSVAYSDSLIIDSLMNYCYHLSYYNKGNYPVQGVAFFLRYNAQVYLFSALHNFTGVDPETGKLIKGLSNSPNEIWVWQSFNDRADCWMSYKLYKNQNILFIGGHNDETGNIYDIGALNANDSTSEPKYMLDYDNKWPSEDITIGDTIFYCAYPLVGNQQSKIPRMFVGKIKTIPSPKNFFITSDIFSRPGSSGAPVFKLSNHKSSLVGVIARGNPSENIVYITPFKKGFTFLKL